MSKGVSIETTTVQTEQKTADKDKMLHILAIMLDGCPLTQPCEKLWSAEGWCKEHCKPGQAEPDAECWLRYAEVMASE